MEFKFKGITISYRIEDVLKVSHAVPNIISESEVIHIDQISYDKNNVLFEKDIFETFEKFVESIGEKYVITTSLIEECSIPIQEDLNGLLRIMSIEEYTDILLDIGFVGIPMFGNISMTSYILPANKGFIVINYCEGKEFFKINNFSILPIATYFAARVCDKGLTDKPLVELIADLNIELEKVINEFGAKHLVTPGEKYGDSDPETGKWVANE